MLLQPLTCVKISGSSFRAVLILFEKLLTSIEAERI
jgi:hypothetical protein